MALKNFMAMVERGGEMTAETPRPAVPVGPAAPAPRTVAPSTSIDASSEFEGKLRCTQTLRIDGCIKGEVECEKQVLIGECATVFASITADEVQIKGVVEGNITARRKITLERTAAVIGDLITPGIVIEEGAKLKGRIVIGSDAEPAKDAKKAQAAKKPAAVGAQASEAPAATPLAAASA